MRAEVIALLECEENLSAEWLQALGFHCHKPSNTYHLIDDHGEPRLMAYSSNGKNWSISFDKYQNDSYPHDVREVCVVAALMLALGPIEIPSAALRKLRKLNPELIVKHGGQ